MDRWLRRYFDEAPLSEDMPVDVLPASNGEFVPPPPTREQKLIMRLQDEKAEEVRRTMGYSRREFVRSAAALGVGFWAIGQVMGGEWGRYVPGASSAKANAAGIYHDRADDLAFPESQLDNLVGEFIFDVQTHHIDSGGLWRVDKPPLHPAALSRGPPPAPPPRCAPRGRQPA